MQAVAMDIMQRYNRLHPQRRPVPALCGCWSPSTAVLVQNRRQCLVRAAPPIKEQQHVTSSADPKKLPAMPQLPQRPAKGGTSSNNSSSRSRHSTSSSSRSRSSSPRRVRRPGRQPMPPIPPPEQQQHAQERTLAGLLAYSGLLGTLATGISMVCPDVDLFGGFSLNPADITLGLQLLVPCCLLNLAIMLPDYSSWKVPAEPTLEAQQKMAEALLAWTANKKAAADAAAAAKASSSRAAAEGDIQSAVIPADVESAEASSSHAANTSFSSSSNTDDTVRQVDQDMVQPAQPVSSSSSSSTGSSPSELAPPSVTPPWMINNPDPPLPLPLARCKDALLMAQGHYLSATPRVALPWPMQVVVLLVNCLAAELLYRSVVLQVSGGWLTDRILEAGAEDWFQAAAAQLPVLPTPHMTGQLVAVALLSGAWGIAVARQVLLMSRRPSLVMASQGKLAAGKLLDDVQRLAGSRGKQQRGQDQEQGANQREQQQQEGDASRASVPAVDQQTSSSKATASKSAADLALAAAAAEQAGPDTAGAPGSGKRSSRKGFSPQLPNTFTALALSQMVQGVRDLTQSAGLGLAFALTGNLAAPFVAAVVTEGLMAVLQRRGQQRSRQRSIAFAKHFASFTRVFRDVQRQQQLKQGADQEQQQEGGQQQQHQAVAQPTGHPASTQHDAADGFSNTASGSHLDSTAINLDNSNADDVLDAAVAAAVAPDAAALHAAAAAASDPAGPAGGASGGNTRMERTISVLDQLLGEQLTEQAAAGK